jgi:hypothetical protein
MATVLIGPGELAELLGRDPMGPSRMHKRGWLPPPDFTTRRSPMMWKESTIRTWAHKVITEQLFTPELQAQCHRYLSSG